MLSRDYVIQMKWPKWKVFLAKMAILTSEVGPFANKLANALGHYTERSARVSPRLCLKKSYQVPDLDEKLIFSLFFGE